MLYSSPIQNRREFLGAATLAALSYPLTGLAEEDAPQSPINDRVTDIAQKLSKYDGIASATPLLQKNATRAMVHWEWAHFRPDIDERLLPSVEQTQAELYDAMSVALFDQQMGLDDGLYHEGIVRGRQKENIERYVKQMRDGVFLQLEIPVPFGTFILPKTEEVEKGMRDRSTLLKPTKRVIQWPGFRRRQYTISPMTSCSAGIALHHTRKLPILAAEDPQIDEKAGWAEYNGSKAEVQRWVHDERNKYMVDTVRNGSREVAHVLFGFNHDFRAEAEKQGVSLVVVTTNAIPETRKMSADIDKEIEAAKK